MLGSWPYRPVGFWSRSSSCASLAIEVFEFAISSLDALDAALEDLMRLRFRWAGRAGSSSPTNLISRPRWFWVRSLEKECGLENVHELGIVAPLLSPIFRNEAIRILTVSTFHAPLIVQPREVGVCVTVQICRKMPSIAWSPPPDESVWVRCTAARCRPFSTRKKLLIAVDLSFFVRMPSPTATLALGVWWVARRSAWSDRSTPQRFITLS